MTQEDVAEKLDISVNAYSKIERGDTQLNFERLNELAAIFDMNVMDLILSSEKGFICLFSENSQNNSNYYSGGDVALSQEIQKLQMVIDYQNQLLSQLRGENSMLKDMIDLLKSQNPDK